MPSKTALKKGSHFRKTKSRTGWKVIQSQNKARKKTKLGLVVLGLIIIFILISQIFRFVKVLNSSWKVANIQRNYTWDGTGNINLLIRSKNLSLVSYNPTDKKIMVVNIPNKTYLEAAHGFGNWQLGSLYDLGESQQGLGGDRLLRETLVNFFAQPIDGVLDFSGLMKQKTALEIIVSVRDNPIPVNILANLKTNLTMLELVRLKLAISAVRFDKLSEINLEDSLQTDRLLDGTEVFIADPNKLDLTLAGLSDPKVKNEHKTVAVFNGTDKALFAQQWARLITNIGADVIITANAEKKADKTIVTGEPSKTLDRLSQVFNSRCKVADCDKIQNSDEDLSSSRGQINIKLAPDLVN